MTTSTQATGSILPTHRAATVAASLAVLGLLAVAALFSTSGIPTRPLGDDAAIEE